MSLFLVILAAGDGKRLKSSIPKPYVKINKKTLIEYSIEAFKDFHEIKKIVVVYNNKYEKYLNNLRLKNIIKVKGGKNRQESAFNALKKIRKMNCKKVIIHDSARPSPEKTLIRNLLNKLKKNDAVIPIIKTNDAAKRENKNVIFKNIQRKTLRFSQTPQGFTYKKIYENHKENLNQLQNLLVNANDASGAFIAVILLFCLPNGMGKGERLLDWKIPKAA